MKALKDELLVLLKLRLQMGKQSRRLGLEAVARGILVCGGVGRHQICLDEIEEGSTRF